MPKPSPYKGQRGVALLQGQAQVAANASQVAADATTPEWNNVQNKPEDFPPEAHTHEASEVTDLEEFVDDAIDLAITTGETYAIANVTPDRDLDANATTVDEVADVLGTLIDDLRSLGIIE